MAATPPLANDRTWHRAGALTIMVIALIGSGAQARSAAMVSPAVVSGDDDDADADALPYRQCVPYAREVSGIQIFGDALTWWDQAEGRYARGNRPMVGAVMSFRPHGAMTLGHVAMVSRIIDDRTVLLRHANWSPIDGRRGQVETDVRAVDVSPDNDWSEVRVWYAPIGDLGTTHWPVNGFIYRHKPPREFAPAMHAPVIADATPARHAPAAAHRIDANFLSGLDQPERNAPTRTLLVAPAPRQHAPAAGYSRVQSLRDDPIGRIIAAHMKSASR